MTVFIVFLKENGYRQYIGVYATEDAAHRGIDKDAKELTDDEIPVDIRDYIVEKKELIE